MLAGRTLHVSGLGNAASGALTGPQRAICLGGARTVTVCVVCAAALALRRSEAGVGDLAGVYATALEGAPAAASKTGQKVGGRAGRQTGRQKGRKARHAEQERGKRGAWPNPAALLDS